ncbi:uncharacterized protein ACBT57_018085 isoform 3-T3 [Dama dama]
MPSETEITELDPTTPHTPGAAPTNRTKPKPQLRSRRQPRKESRGTSGDPELARTAHLAESPRLQAEPREEEVALRPTHLAPLPRLARILSTADQASACRNGGVTRWTRRPP